jgi:toxin ParE1/3/4
MPFGRYVVFFAPVVDGIDVVRVLHGSRDMDQEFGEQL